MRYPLIALTLTSLFGLSACSLLSELPQNSSMFGSRSIDTYSDTPATAYELISVVNGESCQRRFEGPPASNRVAIKALQADAQRFGADAVINTQCFSLKPDADSACYTEVSCVGRAIQWRDQ